MGASADRCAKLADDERIALADRDELGLAAGGAHEPGGELRGAAQLGGSPSPVEIDGIRSQSSRFASSASSIGGTLLPRARETRGRCLGGRLYSRSVSAGPSLYRRHRPRTFADVVGQEHVVRTLSNAITQDKVHHAYLFVGSRGTGKTSMAKILAACLNCERGPTIEPCGVCASCVAIQSATSMDVIEMDAASHNTVDDIRALRDSVGFAPISGRSKVYILDEAHMLTPQAWNAFLKTLEEPPPSTIFVLATTEAQKVLPTVVDRCHRFDFGRPTVEQLSTVLRRVAEQEQIDIAPDALALLARHATGSFRDALGTLEQLVTYTGTSIVTDDVLAVLGVADEDVLFGALDAVAAHDARGALHAAAGLADTGPRPPGRHARPRGPRARAPRRADARKRPGAAERDPGPRPAPERAGRRAIPESDVVRLLDLLAAGLRAMKDGADAAHPARAGARQGGGARGRRVDDGAAEPDRAP